MLKTGLLRGTGTAVLGAALLFGLSAPAAATPDKCTKDIQKNAAKFESDWAKEMGKCAAALQKDVAKLGGVSTKAAAACEKNLQKLYDVNNIKGKSSASKAYDKIAGPKGVAAKGKCDAADLATLAEQAVPVDGITAPGAPGDLSFHATSLLLRGEATGITSLTMQVPNWLNLLADARAAVDLGGGVCDAATYPNLCAFVDGGGGACRSVGCGEAPGIIVGGTCYDPPGGSPCNPGVLPPNPACPLTGVCIPTLGGSGGLLASAGLTFGAPAVPLTLAGVLTLSMCQPRADLHSDFNAVPGYVYVVGSSTGRLNTPVRVGSIATVCVDQINAEGWCNCTGGVGGAGTELDQTVCQDRLLDAGTCSDDGSRCFTDADCAKGTCGGAVDGCTGGAPTNANTDSLFDGTAYGPFVVARGGPAPNGGCRIGLTTQFTVLTSAEYGPDLTPCTSDDTGTPSAPSPLPLTTGNASAVMRDGLVAAGACSVSGDACIEDANCPAAETCVGTLLTDIAGNAIVFGGPNTPLGGSGISCTNFQQGNLSQLGVCSLSGFPCRAGAPGVPTYPGFGGGSCTAQTGIPGDTCVLEGTPLRASAVFPSVDQSGSPLGDNTVAQSILCQ